MREFNRVPRGIRATLSTTTRIPCAFTGRLCDGSRQVTLCLEKERESHIVSEAVFRGFQKMAVQGLKWWKLFGFYVYQIKLLPSGSILLEL